MKFPFVHNFAFNTLEKRCLIAVIPFLVIPALLEASTVIRGQCSSAGEITCQCGQTDKFFSTVCDPQQSARKSSCEKFKFCETCLDGSETCVTCPLDRFGPFCTNGDRNDQQNSINRIEHIIRRPKRDNTCADLGSPVLGSVKCSYRRNERQCTGRCLPGHSFLNREGEEIVLKCIQGSWTPLSEFPACVTDGHCDLEMIGSGGFNCTTGTRGTYCDIRCTGNRSVNNRFFCYPERSWDPPLPYCIRDKNAQPPIVDCKCQNGGTCNIRTGRCKCPDEFIGRFCESYAFATKATCLGFGEFPNGNIMNEEGKMPASGQLHEEGASVVFSCRNGFSLAGHSVLTCTSSGTWSTAPPICLRKIRMSTTTTATTDTDLEDPPYHCRCRNGGICDVHTKTCTCPVAFKGRFCEEYIDPEDPPYNCRCRNGGICDVHTKTCKCPAAFKGRFCEEYTESEDPPYNCRCRNGGICDVRTKTCKCPVVFKGRFCEELKPRDACQDPGFIQNGERWTVEGGESLRKNSFDVGKSLVFSCKDGFALQGLSILTCQPSCEWSSVLPECKMLNNPQPTVTTEATEEKQNSGTEEGLTQLRITEHRLRVKILEQELRNLQEKHAKEMQRLEELHAAQMAAVSSPVV